MLSLHPRTHVHATLMPMYARQRRCGELRKLRGCAMSKLRPLQPTHASRPCCSSSSSLQQRNSCNTSSRRASSICLLRPCASSRPFALDPRLHVALPGVMLTAVFTDSHKSCFGAVCRFWSISQMIGKATCMQGHLLPYLIQIGHILLRHLAYKYCSSSHFEAACT